MNMIEENIMRDTTLTIRVDSANKQAAEAVCRKWGISLSSALVMALHQIALSGVPYPITALEGKPKPGVVKAIKESRSLAKDPHAKAYSSPSELFAETPHSKGK
jgi:addiction module RelB/DinJ family antitoxin